MTTGDLKFIILVGVTSLIGLSSVLRVVRKVNECRTPRYYMDINISIAGVMGAPLFCALLIFHYLNSKYPDFISKKVFYLYAIIWTAILLLLGGLHGVLYRKQLKNRSFVFLCISQLISSVFVVIGIIAYSLMWGWTS